MRCEKLVLRELVGWARQNVLRWFGHIERMEEDQLVQKIMGSDVRGWCWEEDHKWVGWIVWTEYWMKEKMSVEQERMNVVYWTVKYSSRLHHHHRCLTSHIFAIDPLGGECGMTGTCGGLGFGAAVTLMELLSFFFYLHLLLFFL